MTMSIRRIALRGLVGAFAVAVLDWRATLLWAGLGGLRAPWGYQEFIRINGPEAREWFGPLGADLDERTPHASAEGSLEGALNPGQVLTVYNEFGSIRLDGVPQRQAGGGDTVELSARVTVYADTESLARGYLRQVSVRLVPDPPNGGGGGGLRLEVDRPSQPAGVKRVKVEVSGTMPADARVDLRNAFGPVTVSGVSGPSRVRNSFGPVEVSHVDMSWRIEAKFSKLTVNGVGGDTEVSEDFGSSTIRDVRGDLRIAGDFKSHRVSGVEGRLDARVRYGGLEVDSVGKDAAIDASYTDVRVRDVSGDVRVDTRYGDARIEGVRRAVDVNSRYADVTLGFAGGLNHRFDVGARNGRISTQILSLGPVERESGTERLSGIAGGGRYPVRVRTEFGDVELR